MVNHNQVIVNIVMVIYYNQVIVTNQLECYHG